MQDLIVLLIQNDTVWQKPEANHSILNTLIDQSEKADLIVLPEMFSTGFSMESKMLAESMEGPTHSWMKVKAKETGSAICGSVIIEKSGNYLNRFLWVNPDGFTFSYDKRHLFRMAEEDHSYTPGLINITIDYLGWKIRPQVCYDLRFPVWSRNSIVDGKHEYDILINVANWPAARITAWDTLLKARAIENHAYMIGVNRIGVDGNAIEYCGHSGIYDPKGKNLSFLNEQNSTASFTLKYDPLANYRRQFPAQLDADPFQIMN